MGAYATPALGAVVRGYLKVGSRMIVGPVRGVAPEGLDVATAETPLLSLGRLRCLGPPGAAAVAWEGRLTRVDGAIRVGWPDAGAETVWPELRRLLGFDGALALPTQELPPAEPDDVSGIGPREHDSLVPPAREPPSVPAGGWPRASVDTLQAAFLRPGNCVRTPILHVPARPLAVALRRSAGALSPMVEIEGAPDLRPRDVVAARVAIDETAVFLEGTVVTARGGRARLRLSIPTEAVRALLEGAR